MKYKYWKIIPLLLAASILFGGCAGTAGSPQASLTTAVGKTMPTTQSAVSADNTILLGAPTDSGIVLKAVVDAEADVYVEYGSSSVDQKTAPVHAEKGAVVEISLTGLTADTHYTCRLMEKTAGQSAFTLAEQGSFQTQRKAGAPFIFTIQADSHRDENTDIELYGQTLANILADNPDFHIDLGDTFMGEKLGKTEQGIRQRYLDDRAFFARIGGSVPLFLVNGNHEGEVGWAGAGNKDASVAQWAESLRLSLFVNPEPGSFYTGSAPGNGNYYAYTWGDALFVMLDPFTFTEHKPKSDAEGWAYTLGKTQYDWLERTLRASTAKYRFVFIHNLVGGIGKDARGGAEAAEFFEWGGKSASGKVEFAAMRPGWNLPIHDLLKKYGVDIVFHGHDHFFAKQEFDGVVYQLLPQPGHAGTEVRNAAEYSYAEGVFLPPAGHLRVSVAEGGVTVEYVKSSNNKDENGKIAYSYTVK